MEKKLTKLETQISTIIKDISKLNVMIYENADDSEKVRNLSSGINNSIKTIADLFSEKIDFNIEDET